MEERYSLALVAYQVSQANPGCIHLVTESANMAIAVVRQFGQDGYTLRVDNPQVQQALKDTFDIATVLEADQRTPADMGIYPFSPNDQVIQAREGHICLACENAISYKSLLYPGRVSETVFHYLDALRPGYSLKPVASLFTPKFVVLWSLAKMVEHLDSSLYFRLEDYAMRRLIGYGPMWRFSYLVVIAGRKIT